MNKSVVVDTNVLVAGLISSETDSPVCQILDSMLVGRFVFFVSSTLLDEYRRVLLREKICKLHGLSSHHIDVILAEILTNAIIRNPTQDTQTAPDPGDDHLWNLLEELEDAVLVTGDRMLIENPPDFASVISPRSFVKLENQL